jgi:hypothetical protein
MYQVHTSNAFRKSGHIGADPDPENIWMSDPVPRLVSRFASRNFHVCEEAKFLSILTNSQEGGNIYPPNYCTNLRKFSSSTNTSAKKKMFAENFHIAVSNLPFWKILVTIFSFSIKFLRNILTNIGENWVWTVGPVNDLYKRQLDLFV